MSRHLSACLLLAILLPGCDGGLTLPPDIEPGISGTLTVSGPWPPQADSVKSLWIFASQIFPLDSAKVVSGIIESKILIYPSISESLPYGFTSREFQMPLRPATYYYIGVLQRFGENLVDPRSYRVVGVLSDSENNSLPRAVTVHEYEIISGLSLVIDFTNPPPQPF